MSDAAGSNPVTRRQNCSWPAGRGQALLSCHRGYRPSFKLFIKRAVGIIVLIGTQGVHDQGPLFGRQSPFRIIKGRRRLMLARVHFQPSDKKYDTSIDLLGRSVFGKPRLLCQLPDTCRCSSLPCSCLASLPRPPFWCKRVKAGSSLI